MGAELAMAMRCLLVRGWDPCVMRFMLDVGGRRGDRVLIGSSIHAVAQLIILWYHPLVLPVSCPSYDYGVLYRTIVLGEMAPLSIPVLRSRTRIVIISWVNTVDPFEPTSATTNRKIT